MKSDAGDVGQHRANTSGIGDVAGQRIELVDSLLQLAVVRAAAGPISTSPARWRFEMAGDIVDLARLGSCPQGQAE